MGAAVGNTKWDADSDSADNGARDGVALNLVLIFGVSVGSTTRVCPWKSRRD